MVFHIRTLWLSLDISFIWSNKLCRLSMNITPISMNAKELWPENSVHLTFQVPKAVQTLELLFECPPRLNELCSFLCSLLLLVSRHTHTRQKDEYFLIVYIQVNLPIINTVLIIYMQQLVLYPGNLFWSFFSSFWLQGVLLVYLCKSHHCFFSHSPLKQQHISNIKICLCF